MHKIVGTFYLSVLVFTSACSRVQPEAKPYLNIDSLLIEQALYLATRNASLKKQGTINGIKQDTTFTPGDSARWARELDIFAEIGLLNKPVNRLSYSVMDGLPDVSSNLTIQEFRAKDDLPVRLVRVFYLDSPEKLRKIEAFYHQENALLKTQRKLMLEFSDVYNKNILTSYSIEGGQKMFAGDSVHFMIIGTVQFN